MAKPAKKRASRKRAGRAGPASTEVPPVFRSVVDAFADVRGVTRRRMFNAENAFSVNGKIFALLVGGALVVKLITTSDDGIESTDVSLVGGGIDWPQEQSPSLCSGPS